MGETPGFPKKSPKNSLPERPAWSLRPLLPTPEDLERPSVTGSEEQTEGQRSTLGCSTPYVCPDGDIALRWKGFDPRVSEVAGRVQLDTSGVSQHLNLTSSFSWKDHSKKLLCEVSHGSKRASTELVLRVRRTCGGDRGQICHGRVTLPATPSFLTPQPRLSLQCHLLSPTSRFPCAHPVSLCPHPQTPPRTRRCR